MLKKSPSNKTMNESSPMAISHHKRNRTCDMRQNKPKPAQEYQLEKNFKSLNFFKRKDSLPLKSPQLNHEPLALKIEDFPLFNKQKTMKNEKKVEENKDEKKQNLLKTMKLNMEFMKDLTKIYDSNTKSARDISEYKDFLLKQSNFLQKNMRFIDHIDKNELSLSKELFYSEEHLRILSQTTRNLQQSRQEILS